MSINWIGRKSKYFKSHENSRSIIYQEKKNLEELWKRGISLTSLKFCFVLLAYEVAYYSTWRSVLSLSNGSHLHAMPFWHDNSLLHVNIHWKYVIDNKLQLHWSPKLFFLLLKYLKKNQRETHLVIE